MNRFLFAVAAGVLVLSGTGCVDRAAQAQGKKTAELLNDPVKVVTTTTPTTETLTDDLEITGDVTAEQDTEIAAKQSGRIDAVYVQDGDKVTAGQLIASLDATQQLGQLQQAQAQVGTATAAIGSALAAQAQARSALVQARRNAASKPEQSTAAVRQAEAQLKSAQASLQKQLAGARPEERAQAEANVASAKANLATQEAEMRRIETLVKEGALAGNRLDQQRATTEAARTQYRNAVESLRTIQNGNRSEDIDVARAAVRQAEETVRNAKAAKDLDPLLQDQVRTAQAQLDSALAQYQSAQATLNSARAQVQIAQQAVADMRIIAPYAGTVSGRPAQVGTIAGTQTTIARIIGSGGVYFTGQVPASKISALKPGLLVDIRVDGLGDKVFKGKVAALSPLGASVGRLFGVRIQFIEGVNDVRPNMFARGLVTLNKVTDALVIPKTAVIEKDDKSYVFINDNGKAKRLEVTLGLSDGEKVQVSGIPAGAKVIVAGQQYLTDGGQVREDAPAAPGAKE